MSEITLTGWQVLDEGRAMLRAAVAGVPADGWQRPTPCAEWNVTQVLQHAALDQRAWGAMVAGTEMPGENPFAPWGSSVPSRWPTPTPPGRVRASLDGLTLTLAPGLTTTMEHCCRCHDTDVPSLLLESYARGAWAVRVGRGRRVRPLLGRRYGPACCGAVWGRG